MKKLIAALSFTLLAARATFAADVSDPHINIVAKISKDVLAQLPLP